MPLTMLRWSTSRPDQVGRLAGVAGVAGADRLRAAVFFAAVIAFFAAVFLGFGGAVASAN